MCQNNSTRCQVILGMQWIPVSIRQPFSLIPSVNPFPRVVSGSAENLGMSTLGFHGREGQGMMARFESQLALEFCIDMCPIHARAIWCLKGWWLWASSPPNPHNSPHCRRKSDLYWKTWRLRHLHAQKRRSRAWSDLWNWLQRCYSDLFTLMKHIWIGRGPRQTSVALINWLGGHFFAYINNKLCHPKVTFDDVRTSPLITPAPNPHAPKASYLCAGTSPESLARHGRTGRCKWRGEGQTRWD